MSWYKPGERFDISPEQNPIEIEGNKEGNDPVFAWSEFEQERALESQKIGQLLVTEMGRIVKRKEEAERQLKFITPNALNWPRIKEKRDEILTCKGLITSIEYWIIRNGGGLRSPSARNLEYRWRWGLEPIPWTTEAGRAFSAKLRKEKDEKSD